MKFIQLLSLTLILLINGCTHPPSVNSQPNPATRNSFAISGAIAAKTPHKAWTATFYWAQRGAGDYNILIYGPAGSAAAEVTAHNGTVTYREGKKILRARQAEDLLAKETGVRLPISYLYYWIKGLPAPGAITSIKRDKNKDLTQLKQAGYTLEYSDYRNHYPYKIRLTGHQLMVKIVIQSWQ